MTFTRFINILKKAFDKLKDNDPLRLAGATAFFSTFALPPILIIILQVFSIFYNPNAAQKGIFAQLKSVLGDETSENLFHIFSQFQNLANNWLIAAGGFIFLLFVATTLFNVVRNSLNDLWNINTHDHAGIGFYLKLRMKSLIIMFFSGIILLIQVSMSALLSLLIHTFSHLSLYNNSVLYVIISQVLFVIIVTVWFSVLFKFLANAHPDWRTAFTGGIFTGILYTIGKITISLLLISSNLKTIFGASSSFVLMLLFIFYSSFIFYYGACFTKVWAEKNDKKMQLEEHAYVYNLKEI